MLVSKMFYPDHSLDIAYLFRNIPELGRVQGGLFIDHVIIRLPLKLQAPENSKRRDQP